MFKIGDFSKICQTSIKTLRHWDDIGLLKPAHTDAATGYRYYGIDQLPIVHRIHAFRGMGLSLGQVARLLQENVSGAELRGMLRLKQAELQQQVEDDLQTLQMIEARLKLSEEEGLFPKYDVTLKAIPPQQVFSIREVTPTVFGMIELLRETHAHTQNEGTLLAILHGESYAEEMIDVELCLTINEAYSGANKILRNGREMKLAMLPGIDLVASIIHKGRWVTLLEDYSNLGQWIQTPGYTIVGKEREIFHHIGWEANPDSNILEIQFPVTKFGQD